MDLEQRVIGIAFAICAFIFFCGAVPHYALRYLGPGKPPPMPRGKVSTTGFGIIDILGVSVFFGWYALNWLLVIREEKSLSEDPELLLLLLGSLMFQGFMVVVVVALLIWRVNLVEAFGLRWRGWLWVLLLGPGVVAFMWSFQGALHIAGYNDWITSLVGEDSQQEVVKMMQENDDPVALALMVLMACIGAPIAEEVVFRGYLYPAVKRLANIPVSVVFSALLFGAVHTNLGALLPLTILGILLALAYEFTGSLWAPIAIHFCFNVPTVVVQILVNLNPELLEELENNAAFIGLG